MPVADLVQEAERIAASGRKEIVITGINTGDFGRTTGERFADLLTALDRVAGIERYRISSIEPNLLTDDIIGFCAASAKFQPHFHIPLQSGSDRILGLMRRRYRAETFRNRIETVRSSMPDAFIGVDVIVGFRVRRTRISGRLTTCSNRSLLLTCMSFPSRNAPARPRPTCPAGCATT